MQDDVPGSGLPHTGVATRSGVDSAGDRGVAWLAEPDVKVAHAGVTNGPVPNAEMPHGVPSPVGPS